MMDSFGRQIHFPFIELPPNEGISDIPESKLFSLHPRNKFFYTQSTAPEFLIKKGTDTSENTIKLCRIPVEKETIFNNAPLIFINNQWFSKR